MPVIHPPLLLADWLKQAEAGGYTPATAQGYEQVLEKLGNDLAVTPDRG